MRTKTIQFIWRFQCCNKFLMCTYCKNVNVNGFIETLVFVMLKNTPAGLTTISKIVDLISIVFIKINQKLQILGCPMSAVVPT